MMFLLAVLCVYAWSPATLTGGQRSTLNILPRKTVPINRSGGRFFREEAFWNYTTMLLRDDLNMLMVGAREAIFALDLDDITDKKAMVKWEVTSQEQIECSKKEKNANYDCKNYIRTLHKQDDGRMYICGTKAFSPTCGYLSYEDGNLTLEISQEDAIGKCPFDPFQRFTSTMVDGALYTATSVDFQGSGRFWMRSKESIWTDYASFNDPVFIHMAHIPEGQSNPDGDDDKVYLFFRETATEYKSYSKVTISRVARVCKGDLGGLTILQRQWTSFLKASLGCPIPNSKLPLLVQDVFHFCPDDWTTCVFYAVFTPQSDSSQYSAVCAYKIKDIKSVFSQGLFKNKLNYEIPDPRPGACIDNNAREKGITDSLGLPEKTLDFVDANPLMHDIITADRLLLVNRGTVFTRIVVAAATALNGSSHPVMFIGTESGSVLKAVNYNGETLIIEEIQLFEPSEPIKILRLSNTKNQLYVGTDVGVVQLLINECGRYQTCLDCVLARDPYCGWDLITGHCATINSTHRNRISTVIQSLSDGDASKCPSKGVSKPVKIRVLRANTVKLVCQPYSNLAQVKWQLNGKPIRPSNTIQFLSDSLMIFNASSDANGHYTCSSIETISKKTYETQHVAFDLRILSESGLHYLREEGLILVVIVVLLSLGLATMLIWNLYKGHLPLLCCHRNVKVTPIGHEDDGFPANQVQEPSLASSTESLNSNNNNHVKDQEYSSSKETEGLSTNSDCSFHSSDL